MLTGLILVGCAQALALLFALALCRAGDDSVHERAAADRERTLHDSSLRVLRLEPHEHI
jgi:hypothetical protein